MRSARLGSDACLVKEGHGDDFYIQAYRRFSGTAYKWEYQMPAGTMAGLLTPFHQEAVDGRHGGGRIYGSRCDCLGRHPLNHNEHIKTVFQEKVLDK